MKKKKDRKYYIVALLITILAISVGYSLFSEILNISGSANATGTFDLEFTTATVSSSSKAGTPTATISGDKNTLTLVADNLQEPGATVTYGVTITNVGSITSSLKGVTITGNDDTDIVVSITPAFQTATTIAAAGTYDFDITVTWASGSVTSGKTVNYTVALEYEQAV